MLTYMTHQITFLNFFIHTYQDEWLLQLFLTKMLKILPIMLTLCLILSYTYYAKSYGGMIGWSLTMNILHITTRPGFVPTETSHIAMIIIS